MTFHKIKNVKALDNLILEIIFENEEIQGLQINRLFRILLYRIIGALNSPHFVLE